MPIGDIYDHPLLKLPKYGTGTGLHRVDFLMDTVGIDRAALAARADAAAERLAALNAGARNFAERIAPIVSNFCRGLADDDMHALRRDLSPPGTRCVHCGKPQH